MKNDIIRYLTAAAVSAAVIMSGCGSTASSQSSVSEQPSAQSEADTFSASAPESTAEAVSDDGWKKSFSEYLSKSGNDDSIAGYALINISNNGIPSLVEEGNCEAAGNTILVYKDGVISETQLSRLGYSYADKGDILVNSDGNTGYYYDVVYEFLDGHLVKTAQGEYNYVIGDDGNLKTDENGEEVDEYKWNGQDTDKDGYQKKLADAIGGRQMISADDVKYLDYDEIMAELGE